MYMLNLAWKASRGRVFVEFIYKIARNVRWIFFSVFVFKYLFNAFEKGYDFERIEWFFIISTIFIFAVDVLESWYWSYYRPVTDIVLNEKINIIMFKKVGQMDVECFENTEFFNKYIKAISETTSRVITVLDFTAGIIGTATSVIMTLYAIIEIDPVSILFALIPFIMFFFLGKFFAKYGHARWDAIQEPLRRQQYCQRVVYLQDYAKEIRLFNIQNVLKKRLRDAVDIIVYNYHTYGLKLGILQAIWTLINDVFMSIISIIWVAVRILIFSATGIGNFVALMNALNNAPNAINGFVWLFNATFENSLYANDIREFFEYTPKIEEQADGIVPDFKDFNLSVKNLTFSYDGKKNVLENLNIEINQGEKIALVGHNGAGKTTLIKLLLRFYDPTEGEILLNGTDIREFDLKSYRRLFGAVFQDYQIFALSVAENVMMCNENVGKAEVRAALEMAGANKKVETLPNKSETLLTKEFDEDGAVLSGGEAQKIAIARMYAKNAPFAILDEPTSALDPIAEYEMYDSMMRTSHGKNVVFISHRLSSAVLADRIYMMENGHVIETGHHSELMGSDGKYAEMFHMQADKYRKDTAFEEVVNDEK